VSAQTGDVTDQQLVFIEGLVARRHRHQGFPGALAPFAADHISDLQ
jgi:hypothetical protein